MPKPGRRRKEAYVDWEVSGAEENVVDASEGSGNNNGVDTLGVGERGDDSGNDRTGNHANGRRPRQSTASQSNHQPSLGPWTEAVRQTVQSMGVTNCAIKDLQAKFASHMDDLAKMDEIMNTLTVLEKEREEKDAQIIRLENTITTLTTRDMTRDANIVGREKELDKRDKELGQEKLKQEKRVAAVIAEERLKLTNEYNELTKQLVQSCDERKKKLDDESAAAKVKNDRSVIALEDEKQQLLRKIEEENRTVKAQSEKLKHIIEQCDVLERAKNSVKSEMRVLNMELGQIRKLFALESKSKEYLYAT